MPKRAITPEDLLRFILVGDPQLSPDGKQILFVRKHTNDKNKAISELYSVSLAGELRQWTRGEGGAGNGRWSPDGKRIAFVSGRNKPASQIFLLDTEGGEAEQLTQLPEGSLSDLRWSPDGAKIAFRFRPLHADWTEKARIEREEKGLSTPPRAVDHIWYRLDGDGYFLSERYSLQVLDLATRKATKVFQGGEYDDFSFDWLADSSGFVLARPTEEHPLRGEGFAGLFRLDLHGKETAISGPPEGAKSSVRCSPDGKWIAYAGRDGAGGSWGYLNQRLYVCPIEGGSRIGLTESDDYCLAAAMLSDTKEASFEATIQWAPDSKAIYLQIGTNGEQHLARCEVGKAGVQLLSKGHVNVAVGNVGASHAAVVFGEPLQIPEIASVDLKSGEIKRLTHFNDAFHQDVKLSEPEEFWLDTPDGTKLHAWVMKPIDYKTPKKYPAVLEIHGGPHTQYGWAFFHEFQVLAAQGYVVVYSNPRGSKGYGEAHTAAIKGDWGNKDWQDIETLTHWMQHQPYIHAGQLGVMGGSYGGYMTNWAVGHTDAFKAAITDRCVCNLLSMAGSSDHPHTPGKYWPGNPWSSLENVAEQWRQSPIAYFDKVETPMLVIHSEGDLRCNVEQGEQVFTALQQRGIPSRFVRYPQSTFHGLSRNGPADLRIHRLHEILNWWSRFLK